MRPATLAGLVPLLLFLAASESRAEIYQCTGPDGKSIFTSDASLCPGAKPHVLKKNVQNVIERPDARAGRAGRGGAPAARRGAGGGDGLESMWRRKRPEAEAKLAQVDQEVAQLGSAVKACNRGGEWYRTTESGIREHIPCEDLQQQFREARQKRDELASYLAEGLEDECRASGCQPGWVR